jgi:predicted CopG family antitoxin
MQKKLTITVDKDVYRGLHKVIGRGKISSFIEELVRPHVLRPQLESAYARMARDRRREKEARAWAEMAFKDTAHEAERDLVG